VELFINYDCDVEERDIFARIVEMLAKIAQGSRNESANDLTLRQTSLETLVSIVKSQVVWMDREANVMQTVVTAELESEEALESSSTMSVASDSSDPVIDKFERSKLIKTELGRAVDKFNFKPKKGIKYLADNLYLRHDNPKEIAVFLKTTEGLNKTMIGDYLGEDEKLNLTVLYEFVDLHDFKSMGFCVALRHFLSSFRLPGES
jgi:Sec7-like guanine-nucleotide exchange factor